MTVLDAAYQVLVEAGEPLHHAEITKRILDAGLWTSEAATPDATIHSGLAMDVKRKRLASRFCRTDKGVFGLNPHVEPLASAAIGGGGRAHPVSVGPATLSFTDAAERVLELDGMRRPIHYREITQRALGSGLLATQGLTPEATMYSVLMGEIERKTRRGEVPRFHRRSRGLFGLTQWETDGLTRQIEEHNRTVRREFQKLLAQMPPTQFEQLIGQLLGTIGFENVVVTSRSGDGGVDVRGTLVVGEVVRTKMAVQVKRWKHNVQAPVVQQVRGSLGAHEQGLIITTSDYSSGARTEAERPDATPVGLMNGEQLIGLLVENGIGVLRTAHELIELVEETGESE
ncbi:MAG: HTH domain-containing protein [Thermoleophilia bacterium]